MWFFRYTRCSVRRLPFRPTSLEVFYNTFAKSQLFCIFFCIFFEKNRVIVSLSKYIDDLDSVFQQESAGNSTRIAGWRPLGKDSLADSIAAADSQRPFSPQLKGICNVCPGDVLAL